ncbi:hypothetical protein [Streptomyces bacillaris]|uniref:hypothetical protein n=1 Tax=Streptomyces bacillaris TaxID=68179 RepID=UPI003F4A2410
MHCAKSGLPTDPQQPSSADRLDADDAEQHTCPKCDAQPGSPCAATWSPPPTTPAASFRCPG